VGEEGLFEALRDKNLEALGRVRWKNGARTIVTTDPHSYNTLKNEYVFGGDGIRVRHYTELIDELIRDGRLALAKRPAWRVTYHDPCYLGRYNGVYDPPRRILRSLGAQVVEMPRNRDRSCCCGAGGGRIWMEDAEKTGERPAESRVREAVALGNVGTFVTACPKDIAMFRDAVKTTGNEDRLAVRDIAELVAEAMAGEGPKPS
jgi:Fe-S oxidoreductase